MRLWDPRVSQGCVAVLPLSDAAFAMDCNDKHMVRVVVICNISAEMMPLFNAPSNVVKSCGWEQVVATADRRVTVFDMVSGEGPGGGRRGGLCVFMSVFCLSVYLSVCLDCWTRWAKRL